MKRNITVNLNGTLYHIDEDAYALLDKYLTDMRGYFCKEPGGSEIADDIEARVSELMNEKRTTSSGIITIEDVQSIIQRIGTPEEMGEPDMEEAQPTPRVPEPGATCPPPPFNAASMNRQKTHKKFYRDVDHKMLGGVFAGLGQYIGVDPLWLRLLAIVLAILSWGAAIIVYIAFWILVPAAVTPAERLQMKGEPVNMESLGDEIINDNSGKSNNNDGSFVNGILHLLCLILKGMLFVAGAGAVLFLGGLLLYMIVMMAWAFIAPDSFLSNVFDIDYGYISLSTALPTVPTWILFICGSVFIMLSIYFIIHLLMQMTGKRLQMPSWVRGAGIAAWVVSLILSAGCLGLIIGNITKETSPFNQAIRQMERNRSETVKDNSLKQLAERGWQVAKSRNVNTYSSYGEDYQGVHGRSYLHAYEHSGDMDYEVIRKVKVAPGNYILTAAARTDGNGAEIFAVNGQGQRRAAAIPAYGSKRGGIWEEAHNYIENDTVGTSAQYHQMKRIAKVNDDRGYGWSRVAVESITVGPDSLLTYGVTNCSPTSTWDGTWLSASTFELKRLQ